MKLYTAKGDDGTTGLLYGGRVPKDSPRPEACGDVDEAQAAMGAARSELPRESEVWTWLVRFQRDLYVLMAEIATDDANRSKLQAGTTLVDQPMLDALNAATDDVADRLDLGGDFVVPGENRPSALLDVARTVARRAERRCVAVAAPGSLVVPYLNRLSSFLWAAARLVEAEPRLAKDDG